MKKLLHILICLFVYFDVKSDVINDLNTSKDVSRLEFSLYKLIPELESKAYWVFGDHHMNNYSDKKCLGQLSKLERTEYKKDKDVILLTCNLTINTPRNVSTEEEDKIFNATLNLLEDFASSIAREMFLVLGNYGSFVKHKVLMGKFVNIYDDKLKKNVSETKKQKDFADSLKERIILSVNLALNSTNRYLEERFYYPFLQKFDRFENGAQPKFKHIKVRTHDSKDKE